jgi:cell division septum initiation protein DivIVA
MNPGSRSNWKAILYLAVVFFAGAATGVMGYRMYSANLTASAVVPPRAHTPDEWRKRFVGEMRKRLHLDEAQLTQLNAILDDTRAQFDAVKERSKPEMKAIQARQVERINAMLNAVQQDEYARFRREKEEARARQKQKEKEEEQRRQSQAGSPGSSSGR